MKSIHFRHPLWEVIARNVYFPFFVGFFCSVIYRSLTGESLFNAWYDRLFGIIAVCVGFHALFSLRKNTFTAFLLDTLGALGLIGTGVYFIFS